MGANQCTNIQVSDDSILEEAETFTLQLATVDTAVTIPGSAASSTVTIQEDPTDGKDKFVLALNNVVNHRTNATACVLC